MTLPASGAISFSQIATEYGGITPHAINEYYRGGVNVPSYTGDAGGNNGNAAIPTSGQISMDQFYNGFKAATISIPTGTFHSTRLHTAIPTTQSSSVTIGFGLTGLLTVSLGGQAGPSGNINLNTANAWGRPTAVSPGYSALYWVRATLLSGSAVFSGTMNTWLQMNTLRSWVPVSRREVDGVGNFTNTVRFQISTNSAGTAIVATGDITCIGERT